MKYLSIFNSEYNKYLKNFEKMYMKKMMKISQN